jgi:transcriptional regulator with XRE-family HTH domain
MLFRRALGEVLREERLSQQKTLRIISGTGRIALGYLSEVERGDKEVSSEILDGVADALGLSTYEVIMRAGMRMAGVYVPDTAEVLLDEYADLVVRY